VLAGPARVQPGRETKSATGDGKVKPNKRGRCENRITPTPLKAESAQFIQQARLSSARIDW